MDQKSNVPSSVMSKVREDDIQRPLATYRAPEFIEYGSLAEITQAGSGTTPDGVTIFSASGAEP
jgi:hypothetical protein